MRLCRSALLLVGCVTYLGVPITAFSGDSLATLQAASNSSSLDVAQASPLEAIQTKKNIAAASSMAAECSNVLLPYQRVVLWWSLVLIGALGATGGLLYLLRFGKAEKTGNSDQPDKFYQTSKGATGQPPTEDLLAVETPSLLAKINIVDELIKKLRSPDRTKRQKAIWVLGQQGDSRSVQPLVELMLDSDSQQRSLILAALAEIGTRTLQPMNRALAISLQDENAEVRKNAIRDLTRTYELMIQVSQLLYHAVEDPDAEVQETARWALSQMNRIRAGRSQDLPGEESPR